MILSLDQVKRINICLLESFRNFIVFVENNISCTTNTIRSIKARLIDTNEENAQKIAFCNLEISKIQLHMNKNNQGETSNSSLSMPY